jgi:predicted transcriptional regulator
MLKISLFIKNGFKNGGINFIGNLFFVILIWIFSVRRIGLNREYLIALIEKRTALNYIHKKKVKINKKLMFRGYDRLQIEQA